MRKREILELIHRLALALVEFADREEPSSKDEILRENAQRIARDVLKLLAPPTE